MMIVSYGALFGFIAAAIHAQDVCTPNPCVNNGACFPDPLNDEFGYICICPPGFEGQTCQEEIDECDPNPCQNGGTCTNELRTFSCECSPGFSGEECEHEINECDSDPCQNGATCSDGIDAFSCDCVLGFNGVDCRFELPVLSSSPSLVTSTATSVTIRWRAWNPSLDQGDPTVDSYIPYHREVASMTWVSGPLISSEEMLEFTINNLEADTQYEFSVAVVREGENGEGARSPSATARTKCDVSPEIAPHAVEGSLNATTNQLNISWQIPNNIVCSSGISFYSIYYKNESSDVGVQFLTRAEGDVRWAIFDAKVLGEGEFSFFVTLTVESESDLSSESEKILIKEDTREEPSSSGPSFIVVFLIIVILIVVASICIFLVVRYLRKNSSTPGSSKIENPTYENKAVS